MLNNLAFELRLLDRMSKGYAAATLHEVGLSEAEAASIRARCTLKLPAQLDSDLDVYKSLLGEPVETRPVGIAVPQVFAGSTVNYFLLTVWPHLYWAVNRRPDGQSWGVGFCNQASLKFVDLDPSIIRRGIWTRSAVESIADRHELYDGWDEQALIRFHFSDRCYEGNFVFGLLQDWQRI